MTSSISFLIHEHPLIVVILLYLAFGVFKVKIRMSLVSAGFGVTSVDLNGRS